MRCNPCFLVATAVLAALACNRLKDGEYNLTLLTTNDVHGRFFDSTYVDANLRKSLIGVSRVVDSVRVADGAENVVLVDAGDCLQGDNAAYYFNYVDTLGPHLYSRMVDYLHYDALAWGNHDVETGHPVYDRVFSEMKAFKVPLLAGNAIRNDNGKTYFPLYTVVRRAGLKIAILGYTNANIKAWLNEEIWSGMHFDRIMDHVQEDVDRVRAAEKPDVVIAAMHSATGKGDGSVAEAEALDVFRSVRGVDFVVCAHDHRPYTEQNDTMALVNSGSHCRYVGIGKLSLRVEGGKVTEKHISGGLIPVFAEKADTVMRETFHEDYLKVKAFTLQEVGTLGSDLRTRDAYKGMSDYINLIHTLQLGCAPAEISIAAPLTYDGIVKAGTLVYNDLFTIYPYENQLYIVRMTGEEIRLMLEASYDKWIQSPAGGHVLKIRERDDPRTGQKGWSFVERSYNFDSAAGIRYTVDVTKPKGERVAIESFDLSKEYNVAMTSYRASGGGGLLREAGVDTDRIDERIVSRYPEIREILYEYLKANGGIDPAVTGNPDVIGAWKFVPEKVAGPAIERDLELMFSR
jgi:2',3'-cyclic-nucleotide 2'-phosphodiesterase/3'-nucleotidase